MTSSGLAGRTRRLLPALAVLALLASGCGGGSSSSSSEAEGTSRSTSGQSGGEKSIEGFGEEAKGSDRTALLSTFRDYLGALARRDYAVVCSRLAGRVQHSLDQLAEGRRGALDCAEILPRLLAPTAAAIARRQEDGRVTKARVEGDRAFVVFHAPGARLYQLAMEREGGDWKATTVAASVLAPSAATLER